MPSRLSFVNYVGSHLWWNYVRLTRLRTLRIRMLLCGSRLKSAERCFTTLLYTIRNNSINQLS
jgi:hypothetical protein